MDGGALVLRLGHMRTHGFRVLCYPNLRVVVVCRSFDLEDDPRIKAWEKQSKATKLKVGPLDDATVDVVISSRGVSPASLNDKQRKILRSPARALPLGRPPRRG